RALPIFEENGTIREWVGVHADITDERRLEESIRESEERFRGLAAALPQMIWSSSTDGEIYYANAQWDDYTGHKSTESPCEAWTHILHPDDTETYISKWKHSLETGEMLQENCRLKRMSDGTYRWFLCRAAPVRGASGKIVRWLGVCTDVDDQMRNSDE